MHDLTEKAAYLQGLAEGLDLGKDSKEGKVINGMIDLIHELAHSINNLRSAHVDLEDYVETIDEDLYDLEDEVYEESMDMDVLDDYDDDYVEVECPTCQETVCFEPEILDDEDIVEVTCPNCDTVVFVNDETLDNIEADTLDI
ncbi:MAG TPA: AraC family transcriptional regulator [Verrucomicrobiae bacterium]|nr:AraC family transcriptional regulator [Verrucomicrobiae bacterium]